MSAPTPGGATHTGRHRSEGAGMTTAMTRRTPSVRENSEHPAPDRGDARRVDHRTLPHNTRATRAVMTGTVWILLPVLTPVSIMLAALGLQRWEDLLLRSVTTTARQDDTLVDATNRTRETSPPAPVLRVSSAAETPPQRVSTRYRSRPLGTIGSPRRPRFSMDGFPRVLTLPRLAVARRSSRSNRAVVRGRRNRHSAASGSPSSTRTVSGGYTQVMASDPRPRATRSCRISWAVQPP